MVRRFTQSHLQQPLQSPIAPAPFLCQCILPPQWHALPGTSFPVRSIHFDLCANADIVSIVIPPAGVSGTARAIQLRQRAPTRPRVPPHTLKRPPAGLAGPQPPRPPPMLPVRLPSLRPPMLPLHTAQLHLLTPPLPVPLTRSLLRPVLVLLPLLVSPPTSCEWLHLVCHV
jgi:hypothetical protein